MCHRCWWGLMAAIRALRAQPRSLLRGSIPRDLGIGRASRESPDPSQSTDQSAGQAATGTGTVRSRDCLDAPGANSSGKSSKTPTPEGGGCRRQVQGGCPCFSRWWRWALPPAGHWSSYVSGQRSASPKTLGRHRCAVRSRRGQAQRPALAGRRRLARDLAASRCRSKPGYRGTPRSKAGVRSQGP
jgi:hypothetical protein